MWRFDAAPGADNDDGDADYSDDSSPGGAPPLPPTLQVRLPQLPRLPRVRRRLPPLPTGGAAGNDAGAGAATRRAATMDYTDLLLATLLTTPAVQDGSGGASAHEPAGPSTADAGAAADRVWHCAYCTLINEASADRCVVCDNTRAPPPVPPRHAARPVRRNPFMATPTASSISVLSSEELNDLVVPPPPSDSTRPAAADATAAAAGAGGHHYYVLPNYGVHDSGADTSTAAEHDAAAEAQLQERDPANAGAVESPAQRPLSSSPSLRSVASIASIASIDSLEGLCMICMAERSQGAEATAKAAATAAATATARAAKALKAARRPPSYRITGDDGPTTSVVVLVPAPHDTPESSGSTGDEGGGKGVTDDDGDADGGTDGDADGGTDGDTDGEGGGSTDPNASKKFPCHGGLLCHACEARCDICPYCRARPAPQHAAEGQYARDLGRVAALRARRDAWRNRNSRRARRTFAAPPRGRPHDMPLASGDSDSDYEAPLRVLTYEAARAQLRARDSDAAGTGSSSEGEGYGGGGGTRTHVSTLRERENPHDFMQGDDNTVTTPQINLLLRAMLRTELDEVERAESIEPSTTEAHTGWCGRWAWCAAAAAGVAAMSDKVTGTVAAAGRAIKASPCGGVCCRGRDCCGDMCGTCWQATTCTAGRCAECCQSSAECCFGTTYCHVDDDGNDRWCHWLACVVPWQCKDCAVDNCCCEGDTCTGKAIECVLPRHCVKNCRCEDYTCAGRVNDEVQACCGSTAACLRKCIPCLADEPAPWHVRGHRNVQRPGRPHRQRRGRMTEEDRRWHQDRLRR